MKAVIMAGGEGTRLRPISSNRPKPMVRLFDKPVLGHIINLLKRTGINEACLTLRYLPKVITDYVGDGKEFGISIESRVENEPLGTAGSVKTCSDFINNEDFLIISGDCVCDFDLNKCIQFHKEKGADATIVLYAHPNPVEYGLVVTGDDGSVKRFVEKPSGDKVFTDLINTGIYILSPHVLQEIPENTSYDFGKDLFPKLVSEGKKVFGVSAQGYWCDIGSSSAYLQCAIDMLDKKFELETGDGVWQDKKTQSDGHILGKIISPCYIGKNVHIEFGCEIGPHVVLGDGAYVGKDTVIRESVIDGGHIGANCDIKRSVICKNASIRDASTLLEGSVIGEDTIIGEGTIVREQVHIWPKREIQAHIEVNKNVVSGMLRESAHFKANGIISGNFMTDITPEMALTIGSAISKEGKRIGIGFSGNTASKIIAQAIECGICSSGCQCMILDGGAASIISYATDLYGLDGSVFVNQIGEHININFFAEKGLAIAREFERKIESALAGGQLKRVNVETVGTTTYTVGNSESYIAAARQWGDLGKSAKIRVNVSGHGPASRCCRQALRAMGLEITTDRIMVPSFNVSADGFKLSARDEEGEEISSSKLLAILVLIEFELGHATVAVPYSAPAVLDIIAKDFGAKVYRIGRDKGAEELYYNKPYLRDGVFAAARLAGAMGKKNISLRELSKKIPDFAAAKRQVTVNYSKAAVMRYLQTAMAEFSTELVAGIKVDTGKGWVHISPSISDSALNIVAEAKDMEAAEELCAEIIKQTEKIDLLFLERKSRQKEL